ncbi:hypothetical protein WJX74_005373 [Apatococcus lobatus]|uniref:PBP domain-containing protein n=2 Tax=Apatococcus TaxID=904362 RepID=A0AAW1SSL4_9CHLO
MRLGLTLLSLAAGLVVAQAAHPFTAVVGGGSTALQNYVAAICDNATQDSNYAGLYLPYYAVGVSTGQNSFLSLDYDYGIGDYPLTDAQAGGAYRPILQIPFVLSSTSIFYNITGNPKLKLSPSVLAQILQGNITTFDDPAILKLNPTLSVPKDQHITVVGRSDSGAAAQIVSDYLSRTAPSDWKLGVNKTLPWPKATHLVMGNGNVTGFINNNTWTIGFADSSGGLKLKITEASIPNQLGTYLTSKQGNYSLSDLGNSTLTLPTSATSSFAKFNTTYLGGNSTYPLISIGYAYSNQDLRQRGDAGAGVKQLLAYFFGPVVLSKGVQDAGLYKPPSSWIKYGVNAIQSITVKSSKVWFQQNSVGPGFSFS